MIANHYEKCKAIYLGAMSGSGMFDRRIVTSSEAEKRLSRKSVGIKLEVEGKTNFVLWQKNISKQ